MKAVLHPVISSVQKIAVYESKSTIHIVGSNNSQTVFRVLRVDRTSKKDELRIEEDGIEYSYDRISSYIAKLDSTRIRGGAKSVGAFGILGFIRFLEGYYLILITKRRRIAVMGLHCIYKIEDTTMIYIPSEPVKGAHPDEARYMKMFSNIDLSSNFYYSYSYDITHTIQVNLAVPENLVFAQTQNSSFLPSKSSSASSSFGNNSSLSSSTQGNYKIVDFAMRSEPNRKFIWNMHLLTPMEGRVHSDWMLYIIHGFICQSNISIFGRSVYLTLIARRSNRYAGTRFLKRGASHQGDVANEVETEQIVHDMGVTSTECPRVSSFVQMRGSIPGHWSQDITKIKPKPTIGYDLGDPFAETAGRHFNDLLKRYGSPVIVLNLVKQRERKKHESTLSEQFSSDIKYLNQFLPPDFAIQYVTFDMARKNKGKEATVMKRLAKIASSAIEKTGIFISHCGSVQKGVIRVNCVDCLDRTNTAQFALGKFALSLQLKALGVFSGSSLEFDSDCTRLLESVYEDHGDTLALQYGGSQLVHRIKTYRKTAPWTSQGNDIMQTLSRYYSNTFSDQEKQHTINLFLGLFVPKEMNPPIWELTTDYYLHNPRTLVEHPEVRLKPLTQWWDWEVLNCLPISQMYSRRRASFLEPLKPGDPLPSSVDAYADFHRTFEFTPLHETSSFIVNHTVRDFMPHCVADYSPFVVRGRPGRRREDSTKGATIKNPSLTGHSSTSSTTSSASSSEQSDDDDTKMSDSRQSSPAKQSSDSNSVQAPGSVIPSMKNVYGIEISEPSRSNSLIYKRYVLIHQAATRSLIHSSLPSRAYTIASMRKPMSSFLEQNSYNVSIPTLNDALKSVYDEYIRKHKNINASITTDLVEKYARYLNNQLYLFPAKLWNK